jgi:polyisoprenoid-binding protein YceI
MKRSFFLSIATFLLMTVAVYGQTSEKLVSSKSNIKFFSTTPAEDIEANNTASVSTINKENGEVVFSVPMQGFEFEKSLMQKHFNSDKFLDTQTHPKAKLKANMINLDQVNFSEDGSYSADVEGELTIKGVTRPIKEKGTVSVKGNVVKINSTFNVSLADYEITFAKGKPSSNIAKKVEITVQAEYEQN